MSQINQQTPYIPNTDAGARDWLLNFAGHVANDPAAYALSANDATVLSSLADAYAAAYAVVANPDTRTPTAVTNKDVARAQATVTFRVYAQQIKKNLGVSNAAKQAIGLHLDDTTKTPIPAPVTAPLLAVISAESGLHTLRYADSQTPASRRKPEGVTGLMLFVAIRDEPTANWEDATFVGMFPDQPFQVAFEPHNAGKTATYFGKWTTKRGLLGPWSLPVAMQISFGGPVDNQSAE